MYRFLLKPCSDFKTHLIIKSKHLTWLICPQTFCHYLFYSVTISVVWSHIVQFISNTSFSVYECCSLCLESPFTGFPITCSFSTFKSLCHYHRIRDLSLSILSPLPLFSFTSLPYFHFYNIYCCEKFEHAFYY